MIHKPNEISSILKQEIESFSPSVLTKTAGKVISVGDGIVYVEGLDEVMSNELLRFENGASGIAMNLEKDKIGVVLLDSDIGINEGTIVTRTESVAQIPVGDAMLGRVVNAIGQPIDGNGKIMAFSTRPIERIAPGVISRSAVNRPLETGIKAVDTMVPIGKGQRQLIIGDRQTGKTAIAIDAIINQKGKNVHCIYVAIGQKTSTVANIITVLREHNAMEHTTIVAAGAAEPIALQYLAPYSGCAIGEEWVENGKDVLIIFDDLSKHAVAYRTMSLLLHRPPGREAYPGDVFYLHSRLLERAGSFSDEAGGGSMTALPIVETQGGAMTAYIPTNVISITDGQIYLESDSFHAGIRPAVNPGLSVSRVGGSAQIKAMKNIAAPIRTQLAQFRELEAFSQFSSSLDKDTLQSLEHGRRILEILKQHQYKPMSLSHQIVVLFAASKMLFEEIEIEEIQDVEISLIEFMTNWHADLLDRIERDDFDKDAQDNLYEIIKAFIFSYVNG